MTRRKSEKSRNRKKTTAAHSVELAIIGAGTTGLRTAMKAAASGVNIALIEPSVIGGTCLNFGCIPTKALLHAAHLYRELGRLHGFGIKVKGAGFDYAKISSRVSSIVRTGREHSENSIKKYNNIRLFRGKARFTGSNMLAVGKKEITAEKIIIATGSYTWVPPIKGLQEAGYITNIEAVSLKRLPRSLVIIGGGYIACEFATFFASLGTKVTILERLPAILNLLDEEVRDYIHGGLVELGVSIYTNVDIVNVSKSGKKSVEARYLDSGKTLPKISADEILVATGRKPNTDLNLKAAGILLDKRGFIQVDKYLRTANPDVYAIGDVNGNAMFAHSGKRETALVLRNIYEGAKQSIDYDLVPWAVFVNPPVAGVGINEDQAKQRKLKYKVFKASFKNCGRAQIIEETAGLVKVITDDKDRMLGCTVVGPDADNLIHEFIAVMNTPNPRLDIRKTIHIHPTLAEVLENLR